MHKSSRKITNPAIAALAVIALCIGIPEQALAQAEPTPATVVICFRGRTVTVPSYLLTRYVAAGAYAGNCITTP